ncbi:nucleotide-binding domain-containing protein [Neobacillus mesonae]|uniref:nucleotide-binding domain-containing protein n=1 Tax=Neobacillus mesonae TaxID=1193713 RepID=UPI00203FC929|nr:nucleotidyltransferase [Neobacillus mesonae]MCM3567569.1 nucleotidyltransferase [Neobacillus mesonae]
MKNLNSKFNTFYGKHVVLPKTEKDSLFEKKNLNIKRLKEGLKEYNEEKGTSYKLAEEPIVQGSVAMSTVTQNESKDYDIDVAIVFEKDQLPEGTKATKNIIVDALKRKCTNFKVEPTAKTNCVRIEYQEGYHIDFAIYRRYKENEQDDSYTYEHCGSEWRERNPRAITKWFLDENKEKNYQLREVVRLLKMFCKSRESWVNMPGGLIQSVLANEQFQSYERMDECFYYTAKAIKDRLEEDTEVVNPTDETKSLKLVSKDDTKMVNLYNRLKDKLSKLEILFDDNCTDYQAIEAWEAFFNHSYWTEQKEKLSKALESYTSLNEMEEFIHYRETEEFIQHLFPVNYESQYEITIDCRVVRNEKTIGWLQSMMKKREVLLPSCQLYFIAKTNVPAPYNVYWKVKNRGVVAEANDMIRGEIVQTDSLFHYEETSFKGNHYVECYIVKNGECVAKQRINVDIKIS